MTATWPGATGDKEAPPEQTDYASAATGALAQAGARVARLARLARLARWSARWRNMAAQSASSFSSASSIAGLDVISAFFQQRWEVGRLPSETGAGSQLAVDSQQETATYATYTQRSCCCCWPCLGSVEGETGVRSRDWRPGRIESSDVKSGSMVPLDVLS